MRIFIRRFGSHFGYSFKRRRTGIGLFIKILIVIAIIYYIVAAARGQMLPLAVSMAEAKAKAVGVQIMNEAVAEHIVSGDSEYTNLYDIQRSPDGEINSISANVSKMNALKAELTSSIQNKISSVDTNQIGIPLGSLFGNELLAGRGPRIPLKLVTVGATELNFTNSFTAAGINQTKLETILDIKLSVCAILPSANTTVNLSSSLPISQTIIVGKVPNSYANIGLVNQ